MNLSLGVGAAVLAAVAGVTGLASDRARILSGLLALVAVVIVSALTTINALSVCRKCKVPPAKSGRAGATLLRVSDAATTAAAFLAAGFSLLNIGVTARLASRGQREQWRRDEERPIVACCLTISEDAGREWWDASVAQEGADVEKIRPNWEKGRELLHDLRLAVAQLDLLASGPVRQIAGDLVKAHEQEDRRLLVLGKSIPPDFDGRRAAQVKIEELQAALVAETRTDLGLGPGRPNKSLLGKLLAAINGP